MPRSILALLLLAGLTAGALSLSLMVFHGGGSASDPLLAIPGTADAALVVPSVPAFLRDLSGTRMAPAPGETGWDLLSHLLSELLDARGIAFDPDPVRLSRVLRGGAAVARVPPERPGSPARLLLAFEMPSRGAPALDLFERTVLPELAPAGAAWTRRAHRGHEYGALRFPGGSDIVCVSSQGHLAIVAVSGEAMRQSLDTLARRESSIARDLRFRRVRSSLTGRSDLLAYVSGSLLADARPLGLRSRAWAADLLAAARPQGAGVSVAVGRNGQFREQVLILAPALAPSGPGQFFGARPREVGGASRLPPGYPLYVGASFEDPGRLWDQIPTWLAPLLGQEPSHLRERLEGAEEFLGIRASTELLAALGTEAALAIDPEHPETFALALRPADGQGIRRLLARLDGLARAAEAYAPERSEEGITTYRHPRLEPLEPSYAFAGSILLVAGSAEPISRALRAGAHPGPGAPEEDLRLQIGSERGHLLAAAETEHLADWLRRVARGGSADKIDAAWAHRLRDLLPGSTGPLPPSSATFRLTRAGLIGEWRGPLSPVVMAALLMASPGGPPPARPFPPEEHQIDGPEETAPAAPAGESPAAETGAAGPARP